MAFHFRQGDIVARGEHRYRFMEYAAHFEKYAKRGAITIALASGKTVFHSDVSSLCLATTCATCPTCGCPNYRP